VFYRVWNRVVRMVKRPVWKGSMNAYHYREWEWLVVLVVLMYNAKSLGL